MSDWVTDQDPPVKDDLLHRGQNAASERVLVYIPSNPKQYRIGIARYFFRTKIWIVEGSTGYRKELVTRWRSLEGLHKHRREVNEDSDGSPRLRKRVLKNRKQAEGKRTMGDLDADIAGWSYDGKF